MEARAAFNRRRTSQSSSQRPPAPDSGGAGLHRGGNGIHMTYRFLADGEIAIHDDRWFVPP